MEVAGYASIYTKASTRADAAAEMPGFRYLLKDLEA